MDYPFQRSHRYDVSNNWWFLPADLFAMENEQTNDNNLRKSPLLSYLSHISNKNKFKYFVIGLIIILFIDRLQLSASIWIGLIIAIGLVYYLNELNETELNTDASQLWNILKGPLLKNYPYFILNPELTRWVDQVGELKAYNILEFNQMLKSLNEILHYIDDLKKGLRSCQATVDLIKDLKMTACNQFHSLIYKLPTPVIRRKYDYYLESLGKILNDQYNELIRICKLYYMTKPTDVNSHFNDENLSDPVANDPFFEENWNFFN